MQLPPPLALLACWGNMALPSVSFGRVLISIQAPWLAGNQRAPYRLGIVSTRAPVHSQGRLTLVLRSHWLFCGRSHREVIELHSRLRGSQPPLQSRAAAVHAVLVLLDGCDCVEDKQMLLPGRKTERLSCVSEGPRGLGFL